uniref:Nephrocystin 3-like N-terminal domain-containing protein n=1 Tax=Moniliophthora roreri TaxID=221103 RepID=A0A0W0FPU8_MONRR
MSPQHRPFPISCSSSDKHFSNDDDSTSARSAGYSRNKYDTVNIGSYNTTNNGCHIGDMYYIQRHESDVIETKLINLLREYTALKAAYNSGSREPHPEIYPDIRVDVLNRIRDWITKPNLEKDDNIFILHGPIGVSKSAIAQAISTEYGNYKKLAASFFFWRNDHDRNNLRTFVPTLAYQIAQCKPLAPLLKKHIAQAVEDDALLRNLKIQFRTFQQMGRSSKTYGGRWGIDECEEEEDAERIMSLLWEAVTSHSAFSFLPVRNVIYPAMLTGYTWSTLATPRTNTEFVEKVKEAEVEKCSKLILSLVLTPPLFVNEAKEPGLQGERLTVYRRQNILSHRTPWLLGQYLGLDPEVIRARLPGLDSVLLIPQPKDRNSNYPDHESIRIRHTSFVDFLADGTRSGVPDIRRLSDGEPSPNPSSGSDNSRAYTLEAHALNYWYHHYSHSVYSDDLVSTLDQLDPYAYLATALRMDNLHAYYNPKRYKRRHQLVWERPYILRNAFEWIKSSEYTFSRHPKTFISKCHSLFSDGFHLVPIGKVDMDDLVFLKVMLDFFRSAAKAEDNIRGSLWEYCKQKLVPRYQQRLGDSLLKYSVRVVASATSLQDVILGH